MKSSCVNCWLEYYLGCNLKVVDWELCKAKGVPKRVWYVHLSMALGTVEEEICLQNGLNGREVLMTTQQMQLGLVHMVIVYTERSAVILDLETDVDAWEQADRSLQEFLETPKVAKERKASRAFVQASDIVVAVAVPSSMAFLKYFNSL